MSSAGPTRLTDCFWLAAYDSVRGRPRIDERLLGLGLGAGLLAELIDNGFLELRQGTLYRAVADLPDDLALRAVMSTMVAEENGWSSLPPPVPVPAHGDAGYARTGRAPVSPDRRQPVGHTGWHDPAPSAWPPDPSGWRPPTPALALVPRRGHVLSNWLAFLGCEGFAERRVAGRLVLAGLAQQRQLHRWIGRPVTRILPCDSAVAGLPGNRISTGVQRGHQLDRTDLQLAGLLLATGLHAHALATLSGHELSQLAAAIHSGLDDTLLELLTAVDTAVGDAAIRRR